ncbi:ABC transporter substrate-binding protein [Ilumatobacter fluminis]|nr:ABC transporter substrate-binding protein [Ilumatobacter fluminis]
MPTAARPPSRTRLALATMVGAALVLPACSGGDDDPAPSTTVAVTTTTVVERENDGTLTLGVYLPLTGAGASLGPPLIAGVEEAVALINDNGGVLGQDIELVSADEGSEPIETLLDDDVDAIIGPASSLVALTGLGPAVDANNGVVTCSPMATARGLDAYPDNQFFFRTAPSDTLQMAAIARVAERTGALTVSVGYLDDPYGRGLSDAFEDALEGRPLNIAESIGFSGDQGDLGSVAADLLAVDPGVVVVLGDADDGSRLLAALDAQTDDPPEVIINDSIRQARQVIQGLSDDFRDELTGLAPQSGTASGDDEMGFFVPHAIDCVNLIALAATDAGSDSPVEIRRQMPAVSTGGRACTTFSACADLISRDLGIDYNGLSGRVDFSSVTGDPTRAWFEIFTFDTDGNEVSQSPIEVN